MTREPFSLLRTPAILLVVDVCGMSNVERTTKR
jgi:hypothetical protein